MGTMPKRSQPWPPADWPKFLKELRDRLGVNQSQAAARVCISQSQWSAFESGVRTPTRPIACLIRFLADGKI
jgi:transcriptional regulator with XRE-family HTH domain